MVGFAVERVHELSGRGVIVMVGRLVAGTVTGPATLYDVATGIAVRVIAVELILPPAGHPDLVSLVVDPAGGRPERGMLLTGGTQGRERE